MPKIDLGLPSYDSLFSTEEERQEANTEKVMTIPINKIKDFEGHPFHVTMDEDMAKLIDSIKENDMLMPALVRPKPDGTYEMISGHRRKFAMSQLGRTEMNVIIRDLDDDQATILMVDSNIQRENIYPSERGYAYKMRLEAMKHQGKKVEDIVIGKLTLVNFNSNDKTHLMTLKKLAKDSDITSRFNGFLQHLNNKNSNFFNKGFFVKDEGNLIGYIDLSNFNEEEKAVYIRQAIFKDFLY